MHASNGCESERLAVPETYARLSRNRRWSVPKPPSEYPETPQEPYSFGTMESFVSDS